MLRTGPEYLQHERLTALKSSSNNLSSNKNLNLELTGHSLDLVSSIPDAQHHRMHPLSEDELSGVSAGQFLFLEIFVIAFRLNFFLA